MLQYFVALECFYKMIVSFQIHKETFVVCFVGTQVRVFSYQILYSTLDYKSTNSSYTNWLHDCSQFEYRKYGKRCFKAFLPSKSHSDFYNTTNLSMQNI